MVNTKGGSYTVLTILVMGRTLASLSPRKGGEKTQEKKRRLYEYELCIAKLDAERGTVRVSNIKLSPSSAFSFAGGYGFCGLGICSIQARHEKEEERSRAVADIPLMAVR